MFCSLLKKNINFLSTFYFTELLTYNSRLKKFKKKCYQYNWKKKKKIQTIISSRILLKHRASISPKKIMYHFKFLFLISIFIISFLSNCDAYIVRLSTNVNPEYSDKCWIGDKKIAVYPGEYQSFTKCQLVVCSSNLTLSIYE